MVTQNPSPFSYDGMMNLTHMWVLWVIGSNYRLPLFEDPYNFISENYAASFSSDGLNAYYNYKEEISLASNIKLLWRKESK